MRHAVPHPPLWSVWADTGGTFTDCVGISPSGEVRRAKVLSTSVLRGVAIASSAPDVLRVRAQWSGPRGLEKGFELVWLDRDSPGARVREFDPAAGLLFLDSRSDAAPELPGTFELRSAEEAPILAARMITGTASGDPLPPMMLRLATTRGTNALLERAGAPPAFFVTRGFGDVLRIGTQQRPDLFALAIECPEPLHGAVVEVGERLSSGGEVLEALDLEAVRSAASGLRARGATVAAISLIHGYRNPAHEQRIGEVLHEMGFRWISRSSELSPTIGHLDRSQTAVVNAYLQPVIGEYVESVERSLSGTEEGLQGGLHLMTSAGGLVRADEFNPVDSLLSGPAGGVLGAVMAAGSAGYQRIVTFDMGGTSTDVARYDGDFDYVWRHEVGDVRLLAPALAIHTVASGGGSICSLRGGGLSVGPESAGARPGPACYGVGGPLTISDCNLLLGRLDGAAFGIPISEPDAEAALGRLLRELDARGLGSPTREELLSGLIDIANERMADAIRVVSIRRGYDPAEYAMVVFGGAGGQHGCGVARKLGIRTLILPADGSLLSAWGVGQAAIERVAERQILRHLSADERSTPRWLEEALASLEEEASAALPREEVSQDAVVIRRRIANLRLAGQDATIPVDLELGVAPAAEFRRAYERLFGDFPGARPIEVESLRVIAAGPRRKAPGFSAPEMPIDAVGRTKSVWVNGRWCEIPVLRREALRPDVPFEGPCLVQDEHTVALVEAGWEGRLDGSGALILDDRSDGTASAGVRVFPSRRDPVREQLFTGRFENLVEEMGERLRRTALSTNVKERLDFSCALLDAAGDLVANAPHIPVHLGALGLCVRTVASALELSPGDVVVTNHPAYGGSHLPDVTVVTPVHSEAGALLGYVASRAHHAEIGGSRPGSMPADARTLREEGVVIPPLRLFESGTARWERVEELLRSGDYPSRGIRDNLADLRAQVAANRRGADILRHLAIDHGDGVVAEQMAALTARSERLMRAALARLPDGEYVAQEQLDDGSRISARLAITGDTITLDFSGTSPVHPGNLNATPAIVRSAVLYVLRLLVDEPLPLNEGLLRPVRIDLPRCLLDPGFSPDPGRCPAVVGGNTEVSQRLVDTLLKALGIAACSQGTMNNLLWGNDVLGYYETIAGGEGAGPEHDGCSAVHTHMTNTRITDVEVVEHRYPVRVERFAIRIGSGGEGAQRGGDGVIRTLRFLDRLELSVLTQHRIEQPYGIAGGAPGAPGRQWVTRAGGERLELESVDGCTVYPGDTLTVETPGGGGWGLPEPAAATSELPRH